MSYLRIKEISKAKGISGKELASTVNITENAMSLIVNGKRQPRFELLSLIAQALEVDIRDLFHPTKGDQDAAIELYAKTVSGTSIKVGQIDKEKLTSV